MAALSLAIGILPVLLFLGALILMDSYKLVTARAIFLAILAGVAAATICYGINAVLLHSARLDPALLRRVVAPLLEETVKAAYVLILIRVSRVGFMVDAGIMGFAVGTGFALAENLYYAEALRDLGLGLWIVRGLGTAVMHGSTTAAVGIVSKSLRDRGSRPIPWFLPGILLAAAVHALFNYFLLNPLVTTALLLVSMPLFLALVFEHSEKGTTEWLGRTFDTSVDLLDSIESGTVVETPVGKYLSSLERFPGPVVGDMLCLLRTHAELKLRAKGILIARSAGVDIPLDDDVRAKLQEVKFLERSIGNTGLMAIRPFLHSESRDLWQLYLLQK